MLRFALIQLADDAYHFILSNHHLILDGWSLALLLKELFLLYEGICRGIDIQLERSRPFREYIAWLKKQDLSRAEAFWKQTLKGFSAPIPLGIDTQARGKPSGQESHRQVSLSQETTSRLQEVGRRKQLTLNTIVQGGWGAVLSHYSGEEDVVFGATVSGRPGGDRGSGGDGRVVHKHAAGESEGEKRRESRRMAEGIAGAAGRDEAV